MPSDAKIFKIDMEIVRLEGEIMRLEEEVKELKVQRTVRLNELAAQHSQEKIDPTH